MAPRRILVTGGAGFIGSHLVSALLDRGDQVAVIDNFDPFYPEHIKRRAIGPLIDRGARLFEADIRDEAGLKKAFTEARPEIVVHLAALAGVRPSLREPARYVDVNVRGTAALLAAARDADVRRFIFGSSSSVYGARTEAPFKETDRVDSPLSPYAASKVAGEILARTFHNLYAMETVSLRFFTVYGPRQRPDLAIHKFARLMLARKPLPFFGDGEMRRDHTWIGDILAGVLAALEAPGLRDEVINLGGARTTSLRELIDLLQETLGVEAILDRQPVPPGDVPLTSADVTKAGRLLGYAPGTPLREGLAKFAAWITGPEGRDWL